MPEITIIHKIEGEGEKQSVSSNTLDMVATLEKFNASLNKFEEAIKNLKFNGNSVNNSTTSTLNTNNSSKIELLQIKALEAQEKYWNNANARLNNGTGSPINSNSQVNITSSLLSRSLMSGLFSSALTYGVEMSNVYSQRNMSTADANSLLIGQYYNGSANQNLKKYVNALWDTDAKTATGSNSALWKSLGVGAGVAGGLALAPFTAGGSLLASGAIVGGATAGGYSLSSYLASMQNKSTVEQYAKYKALAGSYADLAGDTYDTSISRRGGLTNRNYNLTPNSLVGVNVNLSGIQEEMVKKYVGSPYMNTIREVLKASNYSNSAINSMDLVQISRNSQALGISGTQASYLDMMSQVARNGGNYSVLNDFIGNRAKYGSTFGVEQQQTSLQYQIMGYNKDVSNRLAFQSQFNPQLANMANQYATQGVSDYFKNKAMSKVLGFDINKALAGDNTMSNTQKDNYRKSLRNYFDNGVMDKNLMMAGMAGLNPSQLSSLVAGSANTLQGANANALTTASQGDQIAKSIIDTLQNVDSLNVTATTVNITTTSIMNGMGNFSSMYTQSAPFNPSYNPTRPK